MLFYSIDIISYTTQNIMLIMFYSLILQWYYNIFLHLSYKFQIFNNFFNR